MSTSTKSIDFSIPYKVADISLAAWGRKEIRLAEAENIGNVQSIFVMGIVKQTHVMIY